MLEHHFQCPYCWQNISVLLDPSIPSQSYIEDCEVCCNPIRFELQFKARDLTSFEALKMD